MSNGRLRIEHGSGLHEERELAAGRYVVGRGAGDIALADENVSTRHAELRVDAGGVIIVDLGSRNGTFSAAGQRLSGPHTLSANQSVRLGASTLTWLAPAPVIQQSPPAGDLNALAKSERGLRKLGLVLFWTGTLFGTLILVWQLLLPAIFAPNAKALGGMLAGALIAFPAGLIYLTIPRLLDRYDPEPWYALLGCLAWGGLAATGFSMVINTAVADVGAALGGPALSQVMGAVISAPIVEEFWKGLGVLGVFLFLRREFDGVIDGIIYATFTALGFATVENVIYYARAAAGGTDVLALTFVLRGVLGPWGHPLYTSMFGIGIGLARESIDARVRWRAPLLGFALAVSLHALWNSVDSNQSFFAALPLWLAFVAAFFGLVIALVVRRSRIIARFLEDEIHIGNLTRDEVNHVCSPLGIYSARLRHGQVGVEFVRAAARLALSKWHMTRAAKASKQTVSAAFIAPLRQQLAELRLRMQRG